MKKLFYLSNLLTLCFMVCAMSSSAQAPAITTQPVDDTVCAGSTGMLVVAASHSPSFIWEKSADGGTTWDTVVSGGSYSGATSDTLRIFGTSSLSGNWYRSTAFNDSGTITSNAAMFTVIALADAGTLSGASRICNGTSTLLSSTIAGGVWSSSNTSIATIDASGMAYAVAAGRDTISYIVTNTCNADTAWHILWVDTAVAHSPLTGPSTVCIGGSITFTSMLAGGTWSVTNASASVSASGLVSGIAAGVDTVIYIVNNACGADTAWAVFTVEAPLTSLTISGSSAVCAGSGTMYTASTGGGMWLSGDATVFTVDGSGYVTGRGQGTAILTYMRVNSCGSVSATDTIEVSRTASVITGLDSVGVGLTRMLFDSTIGGTWSSSDTLVARVSATGMVTGVAAGTATITYMVTNTCGISWATRLMNVGALTSAGTITGPDTVCISGTISLVSTVPGGTWSASNANATVSAAGLVTGVVARSYDTMYYTVSNGFGTATSEKLVYVDSAPVIRIGGPASVSTGTAYTLTDTPTNGTWVSTATSRVVFISAKTFVAVAGDTTALVYTVVNGCGTSRDTFWVNIPVENGVKNVNGIAAMLNIVPNPNNGSFTLNMVSGYNEPATVTVTNAVGEVVKELTVATNKAAEVVIDQPTGVYIINASTAHGKYTGRLTIEK